MLSKLQRLAISYHLVIKMELSLYIPRVFPDVSREKITETFKTLEIGEVANVDFVPRQDNNTGQTYYIVFVHFSRYYDNIISKNFQNKVKDENEEAKIVYDDPWFWICLPNLNPKTDAMRELENRVTTLETILYELIDKSVFPQEMLDTVANYNTGGDAVKPMVSVENIETGRHEIQGENLEQDMMPREATPVWLEMEQDEAEILDTIEQEETTSSYLTPTVRTFLDAFRERHHSDNIPPPTLLARSNNI